MYEILEGVKTMKFRANFWTNYVKFELLFIGTWSTKEFYPAWITGETMHVLWPAWNVISILTTPSPPPVRSFRCFNQRGEGGGGGSIIRGTEVGTKGADQRMAEIKRAINCRWAMRRGKVAKQRACKIYTKTIHFLHWFTSVNYNQRERLQSTRRNELNKIQDKKNFHSFSFDFRQRQQREFIFFLIVPSRSNGWYLMVELASIIYCSKTRRIADNL